MLSIILFPLILIRILLNIPIPLLLIFLLFLHQFRLFTLILHRKLHLRHIHPLLLSLLLIRSLHHSMQLLLLDHTWHFIASQNAPTRLLMLMMRPNPQRCLRYCSFDFIRRVQPDFRLLWSFLGKAQVGCSIFKSSYTYSEIMTFLWSQWSLSMMPGWAIGRFACMSLFLFFLGLFFLFLSL